MTHVRYCQILNMLIVWIFNFLFRFMSNQKNFHGLGMVNVSFVSNTSTTGQRINTCSQSQSSLFVVVFPVTPSPNFTNINSTEATMNEDEAVCTRKFHVSTISVVQVTSHKPFLCFSHDLVRYSSLSILFENEVWGIKWQLLATKLQ